MKIEITYAEEQKILDYPSIGMAENGDLVLFISEKKGIILKSKISMPGGFYTELWDMEKFSPFTGKITLSND